MRAPTGVTATIDLTNKITVSWDAVGGATSYNLYGSSTYTGSLSLIASGISGTSYDDTVSPEETLRYYYVVAVAGAVTSAFSGVATGWRELDVPGEPVLYGTNEAGLIYLSWEPVARALFYDLYRDGFLVQRFAAGPSLFEFEDEAVTPHVEYAYLVVAGNYSGGTASNEVIGEANDPVPIAPDDVEATDGAHPSKVVITWSEPLYAVSYNLYRDGVLLVTGASPGHEDIVASGASYDYSIRVVGESGTSGFSNEDSGYAGGLAAPTGVVASDDDLDEVLVEWEPVDGATKYHVKRNGSYLATDLTGTSFSDTTATPGVTYSYEVQAENTVEASGVSSADDGTRVRLEDPATVDATDDDETGVEVSWTSVSGAETYTVLRDGTTIATGVVGLSFFDGSGSDCVEYEYSVIAERGSGANTSPGANSDTGRKLVPGDLCANGGGGSTTTGASANDGYALCGPATVSWFFNAYAAADDFAIYLDGGLVGAHSGSGTASNSFAVGAGLHTIQVVINPGVGSTQWDYDLSC